MSEWLKLMLEEIDRRKRQEAEAREESRRRAEESDESLADEETDPQER